ncbi:MAG: YCF48-related protein [Pseudomonadota bacterium]
MMIRALSKVLVLVIFALPQFTGAQNVPDQLDEPALSAERASQAALLDIAQSENRLIAVGERGVIITRDDGAQDWVQRSVPLSATLTAVAFNEAGVGISVGHDGVILRSPDRGESWEKITDGRDLFFKVIQAADERFAAAEAALAEATDDTREDLEFALDDEDFRRETAQQSLQYGPAWPFLDVTFSAPEVAWAVGAYGTFFRSEDAGKTWTLISDRIENFEDLHLNAILHTSSGDLVLAGEGGMLFHSADGGESFERFDSYDGLSLFGLVEADGFVLAYGFGDSAQISIDGGITWESVRFDDNHLLIGDLELGAGRVGLLGGSGVMVELAADGIAEVSRPTGTRAFLSGGVRLGSGETVFISEAGITPATGK